MMNDKIIICLEMTCGTTEHDGRVTHVIAAGGILMNTALDSNTVFIYSVDEETWSTGTSLHLSREVTIQCIISSYRGKSAYTISSWSLCAVSRQLLDTWRILP